MYVIAKRTYVYHCKKDLCLSLQKGLTVDDNGVGQQQINGTASQTTLQMSECDTNEHVTSL